MAPATSQTEKKCDEFGIGVRIIKKTHDWGHFSWELSITTNDELPSNVEFNSTFLLFNDILLITCLFPLLKHILSTQHILLLYSPSWR